MGDFGSDIWEQRLTINNFYHMTRTFQLESMDMGFGGDDSRLYTSEETLAESNNILEITRMPDKDSMFFLQDYHANRKQLDKVSGTDKQVDKTTLKTYSAALISERKTAKGSLLSRNIIDFTGLYISGYFKRREIYKSYFLEHIRFVFEKRSNFSTSIQSITTG